MSFGLPPSTEINKVIPKKTMIEKFSLSGQERTRFESSIHRITITNEVSPRTVNIPSGDIKRIFILKVELREEDYDTRVISMLFKLIDQRMVLVLQCGIRCRPVVFNDVLIEGEWMIQSDFSLTLEGLDVDDIWNNFLMQVGHIEIEGELGISDIIRMNEERKAKEVRIVQLTKRMMSEKQPQKKRELFEQIATIRESFSK